MEHPHTRALFDYWNGLRNGRAAPFRSEIDPRKISAALANMFVLEALPTGQLRFRVAGTGLSALFGLELRGMVADAIVDPASAERFHGAARKVLETPATAAIRAEAISGARRVPGMEMLLLPLRSEVGEMNRLLGCINATGAQPMRGEFDQLRLACVDIALTAPQITEEAEPLDAFMGLAEPGAAFDRSGEPQPRLTAIEGAGSGEARRSGERRRGHLRLVKD